MADLLNLNSFAKSLFPLRPNALSSKIYFEPFLRPLPRKPSAVKEIQAADGRRLAFRQLSVKPSTSTLAKTAPTMRSATTSGMPRRVIDTTEALLRRGPTMADGKPVSVPYYPKTRLMEHRVQVQRLPQQQQRGCGSHSATAASHCCHSATSRGIRIALPSLNGFRCRRVNPTSSAFGPSSPGDGVVKITSATSSILQQIAWERIAIKKQETKTTVLRLELEQLKRNADKREKKKEAMRAAASEIPLLRKEISELEKSLSTKKIECTMLSETLSQQQERKKMVEAAAVDLMRRRRQQQLRGGEGSTYQDPSTQRVKLKNSIETLMVKMLPIK